ncbi:urease accessory protein UreD [Streptomyces sp. ITFR-16]|uniref:urease accessory protein UreD n=1 Tax=Streptomyces sp. ITFR-16 TaxID=3075198 RepID=UPI00288AAEC9|nr:urease accessory protein UreD [Streptomyces sp. ITFR-16]WNI26078.1 urease accessory protein UreD [Streptomyces sp. ITFR-16]
MSVRATARIAAVRDSAGTTTLPVLESDGPLALRRTRTHAPGAARVTVVGAMSAPLGGDRLALRVRAGEGTRLTVDAAAATVALPGPGTCAGPAHYDVLLEAGEGAGLNWLPEQLISAHGSDLVMRTTAELAPTARLVLREEQILGRHGETTGTLSSRLTVRRAGRPLLDQQMAYGPGAPGGWDGPAVLGGCRAVGQLLVVDPAFEDKCPESRLLGPTAALTALVGPAVLVTAVAADARELRAVLDRARDELGDAASG